MQKLFPVVIGVVAIALIGGVVFLVVYHKQPANNSVLGSNSQNSNFGGPNGQGRGRGNFPQLPAGAKRIFGQITSVNGENITVQGRNGNTLNIKLNDSTKYSGGSKTDLAVNTRIAGYGSANSDGSITAEQLMINPTFGGRGPNGGSGSNNYNNSSGNPPSI